MASILKKTKKRKPCWPNKAPLQTRSARGHHCVLRQEMASYVAIFFLGIPGWLLRWAVISLRTQLYSLPIWRWHPVGPLLTRCWQHSPSYHNQRCFQMLPDFLWAGWGGFPLAENHWIIGKKGKKEESNQPQYLSQGCSQEGVQGPSKTQLL